MGRKSTYSDELVQTICARLSEGQSLRSICRDKDMPGFSTVLEWLGSPEKYPDFQERYTRARALQAEVWADEIVDISDEDTQDVQRSRLRVDSRKWVASKLLAKKYGDRISTEITGKDGGPIEVVENDLARRLAFVLSNAQRG